MLRRVLATMIGLLLLVAPATAFADDPQPPTLPPWAPAWLFTALQILGAVSVLATIIGSVFHLSNSDKVQAVGDGIRRLGYDLIGLYQLFLKPPSTPQAPSASAGAPPPAAPPASPPASPYRAMLIPPPTARGRRSGVFSLWMARTAAAGIGIGLVWLGGSCVAAVQGCKAQDAQTALNVANYVVDLASYACAEAQDAGVDPQWVEVACTVVDDAGKVLQVLHFVLPRAQWSNIRAAYAVPDAAPASPPPPPAPPAPTPATDAGAPGMRAPSHKDASAKAA